jgi:hypothetical protein
VKTANAGWKQINKQIEHEDEITFESIVHNLPLRLRRKMAPLVEIGNYRDCQWQATVDFKLKICPAPGPVPA